MCPGPVPIAGWPVTNSGLVTAEAEGAATISASAGGQSDSAVVTVVTPSPPSP